MQETGEIELLRQYAREGSEEAFEKLMAGRVDLVYSAALRKTGNPHAAEEITQAVFIILAQKADSLRPGTVLSGWLYQTARLTAANYLRTEARRFHREQEACVQSLDNETGPDLWPQMAPLLEDAMGRLGNKDRDAIVLRFMEGKDFREVGAAFGATENAAKKRVGRALEKLRKILAKRGLVSTTIVIAGAISANSVKAAPMALAKTVSAGAVVKGAAASASTLTLVKGALKLMAWTKAKITAAAALGVLLAVGTTAIAVHQIRQPDGGSSDADASWRFPDIHSDTVAKLPPEVKILPTKFPDGGNLSQGSGPNSDKFVGIDQPLANLVWAAYDYQQARIVFADPQPQDRYDFITTLDHGSREALRQELKNKLGLVGRPETRDTNVVLVKVQNPNAPGIRPPTQGDYCNLSRNGSEVEIKWANEPLSKIIDFMGSAAEMPIIDQTDPSRRYSIDIKWDESDGQDTQHEALQQVLRDQLGLELVPTNMPVEMLVVEKVK